MKTKFKMFKEIRLEYYKGEENEPIDNWKVYSGELMIGYLHDCDGIGGYVWDEAFMDSIEFDEVCTMASEDLKKRAA
jgi:hypothetical protein